MFATMLRMAGEGSNTGSLVMSIAMIVGFIAIFYFLIYRPQKTQEKREAEMRNNLHIGDEISTTGGILGRIVKIKDDIITIETGSDRNKLKIFKWAVRKVEVPYNDGETEEEDVKAEKTEKEEKSAKKEKKKKGEE